MRKVALALIALTAAVQAEEKPLTPPDAYHAVMAAQYGARTAPTVAQPDEAQAIYQAYLKSIGQTHDKPSDTDTSTTTTPAH